MFTLDEFVFDPKEGFIARAERDLTNFHQIELDTVRVSNMPAYKLIFSEASMVDGVDQDLQEMFIFVLKNDLVYTIQYFAEPSTFNNYLPLINRMVNSLQIMN